MKNLARICKLPVLATLNCLICLLPKAGIAQVNQPLPFTADWTVEKDATTTSGAKLTFVSDLKSDDVGALAGGASASAFLKSFDEEVGITRFSRPFTLPPLPQRATKYELTLLASMYTPGAVNSKSVVCWFNVKWKAGALR